MNFILYRKLIFSFSVFYLSFSSSKNFFKLKNFFKAGLVTGISYKAYEKKNFFTDNFEKLTLNSNFFYFFTEGTKYRKFFAPLGILKEEINYYVNPEKAIEKKIYEFEKTIALQKDLFERVNDFLEEIDESIEKNNESFKEKMGSDFEKNFMKNSHAFKDHIKEELDALNRQKLISEILKNSLYSKIDKGEGFSPEEVGAVKKAIRNMDYVLRDIGKYNFYLKDLLNKK